MELDKELDPLLLGWCLCNKRKEDERQEKIEEIMDEYGIDEDEAEEILDDEDD